MTNTARTRVAWAVQWQSGSLLDGEVREFVGRDQVGPIMPAGCLTTWPALMFKTRQYARDFVRRSYGTAASPGWRRPKIVRARYLVEVCTRSVASDREIAHA